MATATNLSKIKRDKMIAFLEELKKQHQDDDSIKAFNEIETHLKEKKYGLVWEEHEEEVDVKLRENIPILVADKKRVICKNKSLPYSFIIEGDNLQALYLLEKTHKGKVDCIYIDPPYNTGARDWKYNNDYVIKDDDFRHSKWLSMMKNRLLIAKKLLNPDDSVLICTIDEKEYYNLACLLEELFPEANIQMISTVINTKGVARGAEFFRVNEYVFFVRFGSCGVTPLNLPDEWTGNIKSTTTKKIRWGSLMRSGSGALREDSPGCFYPVFISKDKKRFCGVGEALPLGTDRNSITVPDDQIAIFPVHDDGVEGRWQYSRENFMRIQAKGYVRISTQTKNGKEATLRYISEGWQKKVESGQIEVCGKLEDGSLIFNDENYVKEFVPCNQWWIPLHNATEFGTKLIKKFIGNRFDFPKSLYAVHDCIRFFIEKKPNAIVVDFFAGSGTTLHALCLLNAEDNGHRTGILVTNNEVSEKEEKSLTDAGKVKGDKEWEDLGVAKYVTWPRIECSILGVDINGAKVNDNYITTSFETKSIPYSVKQIMYSKNNLNLKVKKNIISLLGKNSLPLNRITDELPYMAYEDYDSSILFDTDYVDEWINLLKEYDNITELFIVTDSESEFKSIKKIIDINLKGIVQKVPVLIPMANGFDENVKYFKCDWTPRKPENYLLSNALCLHIKEMIELQNAIDIDNIKNVLVLNRDDFNKTVRDKNIYKQIERIWVNEHIVFNAEELKLLQAKNYKYIPREFFGQELREAAE